MISVQVDSETGSEIVSLTELKAFARIETSDDDSIVSNIIKAARLKCEAIINRDIVAKIRSLFISNIDPSGEYGNLYRRRTKIVLPYAPINNITSVQEKNKDGSLTDISFESNGIKDKFIEITSSHAKNIKIVYTTTGMDEPNLELAIKQLGTTYYDNRSDFVVGKNINIPTNVNTILSPYIYYNEL